MVQTREWLKTATAAQKIDVVLRWARDEEDFETGFVTSLQKQLTKKKTLSERQITSLDNIILRWSICIDDYI